MSETYYTVEQIATMLSMHPKTIQRYIREGKLAASKIGKGWRVSGHDLSVFAECNECSTAAAVTPAFRGKPHTTVSSVLDIPVNSAEESSRIINLLSAALNSKPQEQEKATMHVQHLEYEHKVRVALWGSLAFVKEMLDLISVVTENNS